MSLVPDDPSTIERNGIRVEALPAGKHDLWNEYLERTPSASIWHRFECLDVQASHAGAELCPLVGYKGEEPIGLFPVFELSKAGLTGAFSPIPGIDVPYLGPVLLDMSGLKRQRVEKRHRRFIDAAVEWIDATIDPAYVHVRSDWRYDDPRPFEWNGFDVTPRHTYLVDLSPDEDALLESFSGDARNNIRTDPEAYDVSEGTRDDLARIVEQVRQRHDEQGVFYPMTTEFLEDLYDRLPSGAIRPYVCSIDGEFAGGTVTAVEDERFYGWQGGAKRTYDVPVNDLIDWRIMRDAIDAGATTYDFVGANNRRIADYKAKFAPHVATYYTLERANPAVRTALDLYKRFLR